MFRSALSAPAGRIGDRMHRDDVSPSRQERLFYQWIEIERGKVGKGNDVDPETEMPSALDEKLKEAIVGELKRQAAGRPQTLSVSDSPDLFVNGKIDLDALIMVVAGSVAGGP
ncbi:hypothetical protein [Bradyrhizobium sp. URHC0002]